MRIILNGEERSFDPSVASVAALLERLELPARKVAVERNLAIVPKAQYDDCVLSDGDRIEIVHFVGGG